MKYHRRCRRLRQQQQQPQQLRLRNIEGNTFLLSKRTTRIILLQIETLEQQDETVSRPSNVDQ